jgi:hypothetical protein
VKEQMGLGLGWGCHAQFADPKETQVASQKGTGFQELTVLQSSEPKGRSTRTWSEALPEAVPWRQGPGLSHHQP